MEQDTAAIARTPHEPETADLESLTLAEDLRLLAGEAKVLARAELAYQKSRAGFVAGKLRTITGLLVLSLALLFFAAVALVVGLVFALAPILTAWGAMAVVTLGFVVLAGLCALAARRSLAGISAVIAEPAPRDPFA
ncbi:phage holin family protein [Novosphingobium sp. 1949]|uniref:Phage holin family protein n=1 Tax=Novosphingobium organovorum TaxID=2930092 RepID=A0ABT0BAJ1_9SPHN|nr:phage holin family protein [Novosphingobium organovorum]MCJ2181831.1 phage holin family protein [Novosphingobium organovorum]